MTTTLDEAREGIETGRALTHDEGRAVLDALDDAKHTAEDLRRALEQARERLADLRADLEAEAALLERQAAAVEGDSDIGKAWARCAREVGPRLRRLAERWQR